MSHGGLAQDAASKARDVFRRLPSIETERLLLRGMTVDDAEAMFAYTSDPEVTRYVIWDTHRSVDDSRAFLELTVSAYQSGEPSGWGIVHKEDGNFIGTCGFVEWSPEHARIELGYVLARGYWGRGLTAEAVRAMIPFGFERLELNRIEARCIAGNTASARVMEKAGMSYEGTMWRREFIKGSYRDMKHYAVLRSEYRVR